MMVVRPGHGVWFGRGRYSQHYPHKIPVTITASLLQTCEPNTQILKKITNCMNVKITVLDREHHLDSIACRLPIFVLPFPVRLVSDNQ